MPNDARLLEFFVLKISGNCPPRSRVLRKAGSLANFGPTCSLRLWQLVISVLILLAFTTSCDRVHRSPTGNAGQNSVRAVTINNLEPRRDVAGRIIDAHDGCLQFFQGRFYLYGTAYGSGDGYSVTNCYRVYSSPDLERWTWEGELLKQRPAGIYFRPYVVFNPHTRKYVLWYNWYSNRKHWDGRAGVAVSDTPVGPFTVVNPGVKLAGADSLIGDGSLFVDDDGTGYYIYTIMGKGYWVCVERLTGDYLGVTGKTSEVLATGCEAPVLFRRKNLYYVLTDAVCPACPQGSGVQVLTASGALGPYHVRANINRQSGKGAPIVPAQGTWVAKIPTRAGPVFMWMADRWQSTPDGIKGHDFQFWAPLKFNAEGDLLPIETNAQWQISPALEN